MRGKEYIKKIRKNLPSNILFGINFFLILFLINLLSNNLGLFNQSFIYALSIFILISIISLNIPLYKLYQIFKNKNKVQSIKIIIGVIFFIIYLIIFKFSQSQLLHIASIALLLSAIDIFLRGINIYRKELHILSVSTFVYSFFYLLLNYSSEIWLAFQRISIYWSSIIGLSINKSLILGPTISGLWIIISFIIFLIVSLILSYSKKQLLWTVANILLITIIWSFYIVFIGLANFESKTDFLNFNFVLFFICIICLYIYYIKYKFNKEKIIKIKKLHIKKLFKNKASWVLLFLLISSIFLTANFESEERGKNILFYGQNQLGTWDIPSYGLYGREASGMFGLLPIYLNTSGYQNTIVVDNISHFLNLSQPINENITRFVNLTEYVDLIESTEITQEILSNFNVFVVPNINLSFSTNEKKIIWEFVKNGGSLLVMGDHTNVGGIQQPLNDLLKPSRIQFRFDSALPLDSKFKWITCYELLNHPISSKISDLDEIQISVGASLDVAYNSPIILGKYALSDEGDSSNQQMAFLGDYEYDDGEQMGDIVLVAGTFYGKGKVLVFGDTSTFQNSAIPYSIFFIQGIFNWLSESQSQFGGFIQIGISLILIIASILLYFFEKSKISIFGLFPLILCLGLVMSTVVIPIFSSEESLSGDLVYIDTTHGERFTIEPFTDYSMNGLILNFNRNGYFPVFLRDFSREKIVESKVLILNAPTKSISSEEVKFLFEYMSQGGIIILATGYEDQEASNILLDELELDIEEIPLGPVPYVESNPEEYENEPRFVDSWPIVFDNENTKSYYNFTWDRQYDLMVFVEHEKGGLLLISDSQFLLDKNIESIYDYWPGNIIFLKNIIDDFKLRGNIQ